MSSSTPRKLAILGGAPLFEADSPVPQIFPSGVGHRGEHGAIASILANEPTSASVLEASRQRTISKSVMDTREPSYRLALQRRLSERLRLNMDATSVICLTSGTHALRAALKAVLPEGPSPTRNEIIVPAVTVASTVQAILQENYQPVLCDIDSQTWMLDVKAAKAAISEKTAAIVTVDWLGTPCDLAPFRKLADNHRLKLISDSAQSFGAQKGKPAALTLAHAMIYSFGYPKVFQAGSGGALICPKPLAEAVEAHPTNIFRHEAMPEMTAFLGLRALETIDETLKDRSKAAARYRFLLQSVSGLAFQCFPTGSGSNYYQPSVSIDRKRFKLTAD